MAAAYGYNAAPKVLTRGAVGSGNFEPTPWTHWQIIFEMHSDIHGDFRI